MSDLPTVAFLALRRAFFDAAGAPIPFQLRQKRNTQDDPFDEHLVNNVLGALPEVSIMKAPGPLVSPDLVLYRAAATTRPAAELRDAIGDIVAIEVKKLERAGAAVARASGLDFNTTPPCGTVCVYDRLDQQVWIRAFYLFVCIEPQGHDTWHMTALVLMDGNALNADEALYRSIAVDARSKDINLGSYGDGANRNRPMLIFGNPLGVPHMNRAVTLIHPATDLVDQTGELRRVAQIRRTRTDGSVNVYQCYRVGQDQPITGEPLDLLDPFPTPQRETATRGRGKFNLPFRL